MTSGDAIAYSTVAFASLRGEKWSVLRERVFESLGEFQCDKSSHLQDFARQGFHKYEADEHSRTYVLIAPSDDSIDVIGFFTIGMAQIDLTEATKSMRKKLTGHFSHKKTGAYSIAELARDDRFTSAQLPGNTILDEAFSVIRRAREHVGGRYIVVDARQEVMDRLYKPRGFREIGVAEAPIGMEGVGFKTACCQFRDIEADVGASP